MSCCVAGTNGYLNLSSMNGVLETVWLVCDEAQQVGCEDRKIVRWCRTRTSRHSSQGVVDYRINVLCGNVKRKSSGGLTVPAAHFGSINHITTLRISTLCSE